MRIHPIRLVISPVACSRSTEAERSRLYELTKQPIEKKRKGQPLTGLKRDVLDHLRELSEHPTTYAEIAKRVG